MKTLDEALNLIQDTTLKHLWFCLTLGLTLGIEMEKAE